MSIITKTHYKAGEKPTAAELNGPLDNLATDKVEGVNTADKWANREFIFETGVEPNQTYFTGYNGFTKMTTNSTTEVNVSNGGNRTITTNYTATNDIIVRATADGIVETLDYEDWDTSPEYNLYQFSIWVVTNGGTKTRLTYGNYSFVKMAGSLIYGTPAVTQNTIAWRNFQIGGILTFPPATVVDRVELLVKVGFGGNSITIGRSNLSLVITEN